MVEAAADAGSEAPGARPESLIQVLRAAEDYLAARGVDAPRRSAELLMGRVLGLTKLELYLSHDRPVSEDERAALRAWIYDRGRGVPVAHLLGDWDFFGLELDVTSDVLVPRPETEHLVELAIELAPPNARCVDLGTGSGAIAVALAVNRPDVTVTATELEASAAAVARQNVERHGLADRVQVVEGRTWEPVAEQPPFDLLVSNPPYVDPARPDLIAAEVAEFEPASALYTESGDPCSVYAEILAGVARHVRPGGPVLFETGVGAAEAALELMRRAASVEQVELRDDLAGLPRYLISRARES